MGVPGLATRTQGPLLVNSLESAPLSPHTTIAIYSWLFFPKSAPQSPPPPRGWAAVARVHQARVHQALSTPASRLYFLSLFFVFLFLCVLW